MLLLFASGGNGQSWGTAYQHLQDALAEAAGLTPPIEIWVADGVYQPDFGDLDGYDQHIGLTSIRIVHHYLMGGWGLEDTPSAGLLLAIIIQPVKMITWYTNNAVADMSHSR